MRTAIAERDNTNAFEAEGMADRVVGRGGALQQVRTSYATAVAVQRPRALPTVERRLLDEAALACGDFYYGWSAGKDRIEGPSIDLALAAARCWGNCAVEALPMQDAGDSWVFTAAFVDLETGFTLSRQFRQSKNSRVDGKMDEERKDDIRFQIGQSKAIRNVVINALPTALINKAIEKAKAGVRDTIEQYIKANSLAAAQDWLVKALAKCGVKESAILQRAGVADRKGLDLDQLVILRGDLHALENGKERAETLFPIAEANAGPPIGKTNLRKSPSELQDQGPPLEPPEEPPTTPAKAQSAAPADSLPAPAATPEDQMALKDFVDDLSEEIKNAEAKDLDRLRQKIRETDWIGPEWRDGLLKACDRRQEQLQPAAPTKGKQQ